MGQVRTLLIRGFSLVELLVSMVLLAAIVLLASYSFSQFSQHWDGRLGNFDRAFTELRNRWLLEEIILSVHPYAVLNDAGGVRFYFEGNINGFVAVASESISEIGVPAIVRLSLKQNPDQTFDLSYEEAPMRGAALKRLTSQVQFHEPVILFSSLINPSFSYFGLEPRQQERDGLETLRKDVWADAYNSAATGIHPKRVQLKWANKDGRDETLQVELMQPIAGHVSNFEEDLGI